MAIEVTTLPKPVPGQAPAPVIADPEKAWPDTIDFPAVAEQPESNQATTPEPVLTVPANNGTSASSGGWSSTHPALKVPSGQVMVEVSRINLAPLGLVLDTQNFAPNVMVKHIGEGAARSSVTCGPVLEVGDLITGCAVSGAKAPPPVSDTIQTALAQGGPTSFTVQQSFTVEVERGDCQQLGLVLERNGAYATIAQVLSGGLCHDKGIQVGDVVLSINKLIGYEIIRDEARMAPAMRLKLIRPPAAA